MSKLLFYIQLGIEDHGPTQRRSQILETKNSTAQKQTLLAYRALGNRIDSRIVSSAMYPMSARRTIIPGRHPHMYNYIKTLYMCVHVKHKQSLSIQSACLPALLPYPYVARCQYANSVLSRPASPPSIICFPSDKCQKKQKTPSLCCRCSSMCSNRKKLQYQKHESQCRCDCQTRTPNRSLAREASSSRFTTRRRRRRRRRSLRSR